VGYLLKRNSNFSSIFGEPLPQIPVWHLDFSTLDFMHITQYPDIWDWCYFSVFLINNFCLWVSKCQCRNFNYDYSVRD